MTVGDLAFSDNSFPGKSELEGVLITHQSRYKFHKGGYNRAKDTYWYVCHRKRHGCPARATHIRKVETSEDGSEMLTSLLCDVSHPDHHSHGPEFATVMADVIMTKCKQRIVQEGSNKTSGKKYFKVIACS